MSLLLKKNERESMQLENVAEEIREATAALARIEGKLDASSDVLSLTDQIADLKKEKVSLEIGKDKLVEDNDRKIRETEHKVGLVQKRQDFEIEAAKRGAQLDVREENLKEQEKRFEKHIEFVSERFNEQVSYLQDILGKVLERLPDVNVALGGETGGEKDEG